MSPLVAVTAVVLLTAVLAATAVDAGTSQVMTMPYKSDLRVHPFFGLIASDFSYINGATVAIEFGFNPLYDRLYFDYSGQFPITGQFDNTTGVLYLQGSATTSEYAAAIASVAFYTLADDGTPRTLTWTYGDNSFFASLTEHVYKFFYTAMSWTAAKSFCEQDSYLGVPGYLATITSADEQSEISRKLTTTAWIGATDSANWGNWRWVSGPEGNMSGPAGTPFWNGASMYNGGSTLENTFAAWNRFQPNNLRGDGNDFAYLVNSADYQSAYWAVAQNSQTLGGYLCEYGAPWVGNAIPQGSSGSVQLFVDCQLFTTPGDCTNHKNLGCSYSNQACTQSSCSSHMTLNTCALDARCEWSVDSDVGLCVATRCSAMGQSACAADVTCMWSSSICVPAPCSSHKTSCLCNSHQSCTWRSGICGDDNTLDCSGLDIVFVMDASLDMGNTFGRYTQGFLGLTTNLMTTDFSLTGTNRTTVPSATTVGSRVGFVSFTGGSPFSTGTISGVSSDVLSDLAAHQTAFVPRSKDRKIATALQAALNLFDGAVWRKRVVVILSSGNLTDAATIAQQYSANYKTGVLAQANEMRVSIAGFALKATDVDTPSSYAANVSLNFLTASVYSTILENVVSRAVYGLCSTSGTSLAAAIRPNSPASLLCTTMPSATACATNPTCAWDASSQLCLNSACTKYCSTSDCQNDNVCAMNGTMNQCIQLCMSLNETTCGVSQGIGACVYNFPNAVCMNLPCVGNPTEDGCIADPAGCLYDPTNSVVCMPKPCNTQDSSQCAAMGCSWTGTANPTCFNDTCATLTNPASCAQRLDCAWSSNACSANYCGLHRTEEGCQADTACQWSTGTAVAACIPAPCTFYDTDPSTLKQNCQSDANCLFSSAAVNRVKDTCLLKTCDRMKRSCDCAKVPGCLWRNDTCKDDTFVQCPAMDVMFAIEATPVMKQAFGRHPNGYVGILEAIRTWAKQAPFSSTLSSSGFRLGLISYGHQRALSVPVEIGAGANFTSNAGQFVNTGQVLDWFEQNEPDYANGGQTGSVALNPALKKATEIFTSESPANRRRLLVILGTNGITDGGPEMSRYITALETLGVRIFVNVVRRFSYITPQDELAAAFLMPMASDPPASFFTYTTIDEMTVNLLEKFCDPSTQTGKALQISRDGEVPCNWLTGATECNIQGTCLYDAQANLTCPQSNQCPTMGCRALPDAIAKVFSCANCQYISGSFVCKKGSVNPPKTGVCKKSTCAQQCNNNCNGVAGCTWMPANRCERDYCSSSTDQPTCNGNLGCVWNSYSGAGACQRSMCGTFRAQTSCNFVVQQEAGGSYSPCWMNNTLAPAICIEMRCPQLDTTSCKATSNCVFTDGLGYRGCSDKVCQYQDAETCEFDSQCYWDPFKVSCNQQQPGCVLSGYSDWSTCSATCGASISYKTRSVLQYPTVFGALTCPQEAARGCLNDTVSGCDSKNDVKDTKMTVVRTCTMPPASSGLWIPPNPSAGVEGQWPMNCTQHCTGITDQLQCIQDASCRWMGNGCQVASRITCAALLSADDCAATDQCLYNVVLELCEPVLTVCNFTSPTSCSTVAACTWRAGASAVAYGNSLSLPTQLVNPGQSPIYPFYNLQDSTPDVVNGATVSIETNYERGKDQLVSTYNLKVSSLWMEQSGTLLLFGRASVAEYVKTIRFVTFETTSTRTGPRRVTWSFGNNTVYSSVTRHHYRKEVQAGASYDFALSFCTRKSFFGLQGYLATVLDAGENDLVSSKLFATGWISGDDANDGNWAYSSGPEFGKPFWRGPSAPLGGQSLNGSYTNWAPPNMVEQSTDATQAAALVNGEPVSNTGTAGLAGIDRVYLSRTGFWESRPLDTVNVNGFVCEFGGMAGDVRPSYPIGGATVLGMAGCIPQACVWHSSQSNCVLDSECSWVNGACVKGCNSRSSESDCSSTAACRWDTSILPPVCTQNDCTPLGVAACKMNAMCEYDPATQCRYKKGCAQFDLSSCAKYPTCQWNGNACAQKPCASYSALADCRSTPMCQWSFSTARCIDQICTFGSSQLCSQDSRCMWNTPDSISIGFTPSGGDVYPFTDGVEIPIQTQYNVDGITVAVTAGYQKGDLLAVEPDAQQVFSSVWSESTGMLSITVATGAQVNVYQAFQYAQLVRFSSKSTNFVRRQVAYVLNARTIFSPTRRTFYKWIPTTSPMDYATASAMCSSSTFFDLQGVIAQIDLDEAASLISRMKANGWIGATSNAQARWSWSASGLNFWQGGGSLGRPISDANDTYLFAQWDLGEPAVNPGASLLNSNGMWRAVDATGQQSGVVCMYGSASIRSAVAASGVRNAVPAGCFAAPCLNVGQSDCVANPTCRWSAGACTRDTGCLPATASTDCNLRQGCYWDLSTAICVQSPANECIVVSNSSLCQATAGCVWKPELIPTDPSRGLGGCDRRGCAAHPTSSACMSDPTCKWTASTGCVARLCGYNNGDSCWSDPLCMWTSMCLANPCGGVVNQSACTMSTCSWNAKSNACQYKRCSTSASAEVCMLDKGCLWLSGQCFEPSCKPTDPETLCNVNPQCFFFAQTKMCAAAQCLANTNLQSCEQGQTVLAKKPCIWVADKNLCRQPTIAEQNAPPGSGLCEKQKDPNLWWLWLFLAIILALVAVIIYKLYVSMKSGKSIFEPTRKNYKYNPHEQFAAELFEDAKVNGVETNVSRV